MAIGLSITEFAGGHRRYNTQTADFGGQVTCQSVAIGATVVSSSPLGPYTHLVRLCADASCSVIFNDSGISAITAVTYTYLPANVPEYFTVSPGMTISVIAAS